MGEFCTKNEGAAQLLHAKSFLGLVVDGQVIDDDASDGATSSISITLWAASLLNDIGCP